MGIAALLRKISMLLRRNRFRSELDEEMAFHRAQVEQELRAQGMSPREARRAAKRQFGDAERIQERSQEIVGLRFESVIQDSRFALRQLRNNPGFAVTAMAILALGIGASVAIFGFVDAALIHPLPYADPTRLMGVYETAKGCPRCPLSYQDYLDWKQQNHSFVSLEAWGMNGYLLPTPSGADPVQGVRVSDGFFRALGVTPILGRDFYAGESTPNAPRTVLLSYTTWQTRFGGQRSVIGQSVKLSDQMYTIVGVLPAEFHFAPRGRSDFWTTLHDPNGCETHRYCHNLFGLARLKDGVTVAAALADAKAIAQRLETQYPGSNHGQGAIVVPLPEVIVGDMRTPLLVLLGGSALLLLIACVNVSSLVLVRAESRRREIAVRGALGASRGRLMGQFATESIVLVLSATLLGLGFASVGMQALSGLISKDTLEFVPYLKGLHLNLHCFLFTGVLAFLAALWFSAVPALRLPLGRVREGLADGGRGSAGITWRSLGAHLVVVELATAVVLLASAGLLTKSFYKLLHVDANFDTSNLAMVDVQAPDSAYGKPPQALALDREVIRRISSLPGVVSVGLTTDPPLTCNCDTTWFRVMGHPWNGEHYEAPQRDVSPEYFHTLQAKILRGRGYVETDDGAKPTHVMINRTLAQQFFPNEDPIGKKIGDLDLDKDTLREIVGVVDDIREGGLDSDIRPAIYYPMYEGPDNNFTVVVRTQQQPGSVLAAMAAAVHHVDPGIGVTNERTMTEQIETSQTAYIHRSAAYLVSGFAALALVLGTVGLYGVVAFSVGQRTREIGVRMALGAQRGSVYRLILREAGILAAVGIVIGLGCAVGAASTMRMLLFGVAAWDAGTLGSVAVLLGAAALLASFFPAHRAAGVDPAEALRAE